MKQQIINVLKKHGVCTSVINSIRQFTGTTQEYWDQCEQGDQMLWFLGRLSGRPWGTKRKKLTLCLCECVRLRWTSKKKGGKVCIMLLEKWAAGEAITPTQLRTAGAAASLACAYAAVYVVDTAGAVSTERAAVYATITAECVGRRNNVLKQQALIVRKHYPVVPI